MDTAEFECPICLDICKEAVEATCCDTLFCEACSNALTECPTCRQIDFKAVPNKFARKCIGRMKIACDKCGASIQRNSVYEHLQVCEMRELKCGARECSFAGVKSDLLEHVVCCHEEDILTITQQLGRTHIFKVPSADFSMQTMTEMCDCAVQTVSDFDSTCYLMSKVNFERHKPLKNQLKKHFCGRTLNRLCPCKFVLVINEIFGCQGGFCGPNGHNCADCQLLDLMERGWPLKGYVVGVGGSKVNLRAANEDCVLEGGYHISSEECDVCRVYKLLSSDPTSLYHQFL